jgi:ribonuclease R
VVTSVTGFGLFVELKDIYVEGMVHITALPADYYHFESVYHRLVGERSGRSYRLGDSIEVVVARVDLDERKIDFELSMAEQSAPVTRRAVPAGAEKTARKTDQKRGGGRQADDKKARPAKGKKRKAVSKSRKSGYYE